MYSVSPLGDCVLIASMRQPPHVSTTRPGCVVFVIPTRVIWYNQQN